MSTRSRDTSRSARAQQALASQRAKERRRNLLVGGAVAIVVMVVIVVGFVVSSGRDTTGRATDVVPDGVTDSWSVVVGEESAPHTITVYEDLQCPVCAAFEGETFDAVAAAVEGGEVKVEYRMVAFLDDASSTDYSSRALNALMAVLDTSGPDVFAEYHRILYAHQPAEGSVGLSEDQLVEYAVQAGADEADVRPLVEDDVFHQWVVDATDQMSREGITRTPTVLIDGESAGKTPAASSAAVLDLVG